VLHPLRIGDASRDADPGGDGDHAGRDLWRLPGSVAGRARCAPVARHDANAWREVLTRIRSAPSWRTLTATRDRSFCGRAWEPSTVTAENP
jgi:hypothetical protein